MSNVNQRMSVTSVVNEVFSRLDRSRNGVIERPAAGQQGETSLGLRDRLLLTTARAAGFDIPRFNPADIAAAADTNGDTRLTRAELTAFVNRLDTNHDRYIDRAEFSRGLDQLRNGQLR